MKILLLLLGLAILFTRLPATESQPSYIIHTCKRINTSDSTYKSDLTTLLQNLSSSAESYFKKASTKNPTIEALYQCRLDISLDECKACVGNATTFLLQRCYNKKFGVVWYDECLVRYANETIASVLSTSPLWDETSNQTVLQSDQTLFTGYVREDLESCATEAANSPSKFAVRDRNTNFKLSTTNNIYTLVQCTEDISAGDCSKCLQAAFAYFSRCCVGQTGAMFLMPSCYFRFESFAFYNVSGIASIPSLFSPSPSLSPSPSPSFSPSPSPSPLSRSPSRGKSGISKGAVIAICIIIGALSVIFFIGCFVYVRLRGRTDNVLETKDSSKTKESLVYSLNKLKAATNNFSEENLLGRGGYGGVFKGTLENGQEIAVKRLAAYSCQGETEFKNEVSLVANLQHRNLTMLLGFCWEGDERILVYECVPNKSLDLFLFENEKERSLDWAQRYKIIEGVARGILYLHEDSRLKIIHRDLKASNVLLDGFFNPKISDFGMARIFNIDETRASTRRIVGTYGYMAPEYALHGKFSVKSDVFSFGVLVLEIITGLKATMFYSSDGYGNLIRFVWKHWEDKKITEVVDKAMEGRYSEQELLRCVQVALQCVEEAPMDRPSMATVVQMLNSESTLNIPKQPFLYL